MQGFNFLEHVAYINFWDVLLFYFLAKVRNFLHLIQLLRNQSAFRIFYIKDEWIFFKKIINAGNYGILNPHLRKDSQEKLLVT